MACRRPPTSCKDRLHPVRSRRPLAAPSDSPPPLALCAWALPTTAPSPSTPTSPRLSTFPTSFPSCSRPPSGTWPPFCHLAVALLSPRSWSPCPHPRRAPGRRTCHLHRPPAAQPAWRHPCHLTVTDWEAALDHAPGAADGLPPDIDIPALRQPLSPRSATFLLAFAITLECHEVTPHDTHAHPPQRVAPPALPLGGGSPGPRPTTTWTPRWSAACCSGGTCRTWRSPSSPSRWQQLTHRSAERSSAGQTCGKTTIPCQP